MVDKSVKAATLARKARNDLLYQYDLPYEPVGKTIVIMFNAKDTEEGCEFVEFAKDAEKGRKQLEISNAKFILVDGTRPVPEQLSLLLFDLYDSDNGDSWFFLTNACCRTAQQANLFIADEATYGIEFGMLKSGTDGKDSFSKCQVCWKYIIRRSLSFFKCM